MQKFIVVFFITAISIFIFSCQKQVAQNINSSNENLKVQSVYIQSETPKDWKRIETNSFSFSIPQSLKKNNVTGIDSFVLQFKNNEMTLDIEWGDYSQDVGFHSKDYENKEEQTEIDGERTAIVSWDVTKPTSSQMSNGMSMINGTMSGEKAAEPQKIEKNYHIGVNFPHKNEVISPEDRPAISFVVRSKNLESQEIAKTIFQSIKFKK